MTKTIWMTAAAATAILYSFSVPVQAHGLQDQHYQCYKILEHGNNPPNNVTLEDQFVSTEDVTGPPVRLCNPVDKNGEGIPHRNVHLVCYKLPPADIDPISVTVRNQFTDGEVLVIGDRDMLCVPSLKQINQ